ncbi:MAG: hypothetical protein M1819_002189 [Sarea resinae]|nr:MAG: hypothetical protein M1819_002189 [Sarea resinae]
MSSTRVSTFSGFEGGISNITEASSRSREQSDFLLSLRRQEETEARRQTPAVAASRKEKGVIQILNDNFEGTKPQATTKRPRVPLSTFSDSVGPSPRSSMAPYSSVPSVTRTAASPPAQSSPPRQQESHPQAVSLVTSALSPAPLAQSASGSPTRVCLCQPDPKIPRPRNAFILYRQHLQSTFVADRPGLSNPEISKLIGQRWQAEPPEIKNQWKNLAEEEKVRHQQSYPDYRYKPRRSGSSNNTANNTTLLSPPSASSPTSSGSSQAQTTPCAKCGGRSITALAPSTPRTPFTHNFHPQPVSSAPTSTISHLPTLIMNTPIIGPPQQRRYPLGLNLQRYSPQFQPQQQQPQGSPKSGGLTGVLVPQTRLRDDGNPTPLSPDPKRRKYKHPGPYTPATATAYTFPRRRESLMHPDMVHRHGAEHGQQLYMGPPQPPPPPSSLALLQTPTSSTLIEHGSADVEVVVRNIPFLNKIRLLNRISRPLRVLSQWLLPSTPSPPGASAGPHRLSPSSSHFNNIRGAVIAVEGPDEVLRDAVVKWLEKYLSKSDEHLVRVEDQGPHNPFVRQQRQWQRRGTASEKKDQVDNNKSDKPMNVVDGFSADNAIGHDDDGKNGGELFAQYLRFVAEWHAKSREIVHFITNAASSISTDTATTAAATTNPSTTPMVHRDRTRPSPVIPSSETIVVHQPRLEKPPQTNPKPSRSSPNSAPHTTPTTTTSTTTTKPTSKPPTPNRPSPTAYPAPHPTPTPIVLLNTYILATTDAATLALPIHDAYSAADHWQWMATLWRGIVGPDITVYVKEAPADEVARYGAVEVRPDAAAVVVRVVVVGPASGGDGDGPGTGVGLGIGMPTAALVEEKTLRRLGFEIGEWVRGLGGREDDGVAGERGGGVAGGGMAAAESGVRGG